MPDAADVATVLGPPRSPGHVVCRTSVPGGGRPSPGAPPDLLAWVSRTLDQMSPTLPALEDLAQPEPWSAP